MGARQPLPQERRVPMHMHTHAPRKHARPPPRLPGRRLVSTSPLLPPPPTGRGPLTCGLWRPQARPGQAGLRAPDAPAPPPPAVSMGSLARCHNVPPLAPLPIKKTLGTGRRKSPGKSQVSEEGTEGVEVCLVSEPRAWGCPGVGGGGVRGYLGPSKEEAFGHPLSQGTHSAARGGHTCALCPLSGQDPQGGRQARRYGQVPSTHRQGG